jgi:hypothetical protein
VISGSGGIELPENADSPIQIQITAVAGLGDDESVEIQLTQSTIAKAKSDAKVGEDFLISGDVVTVRNGAPGTLLVTPVNDRVYEANERAVLN